MTKSNGTSDVVNGHDSVDAVRDGKILNIFPKISKSVTRECPLSWTVKGRYQMFEVYRRLRYVLILLVLSKKMSCSANQAVSGTQIEI